MIVLYVLGYFDRNKQNSYYMNIVHTPNHYFKILDGVPYHRYGELIPLHLPSFSVFIRPLKQ